MSKQCNLICQLPLVHPVPVDLDRVSSLSKKALSGLCRQLEPRVRMLSREQEQPGSEWRDSERD